MPLKAKLYLMGLLSFFLSASCSTKKVKSPSAYLRLGTVNNMPSPTNQDDLGFSITKKLANHLGYQLTSEQVSQESLADKLINNKYDFILGPKNLAEEFPMLKVPEGFQLLNNDLLQLAEDSNHEETSLIMVNQDRETSRPESLTLFLKQENSLIFSLERLILVLRNHYSPLEILNNWGL